MDGVFVKEKSSLIFNIIGIIAGVFLMLLFGFLRIADVSMTLDDNIGSIFFMLFGLICIIISFVSLFFNFKAYLHIEDGHISARFNWNTRLECDVTEIAFVDYFMTSITVKLKDGKRYNILGLENAAQIYTLIRKRMLKLTEINSSAFDKNALLSKIKKIAQRRRNEWIFLVIGFVVMFANIFLCVALTGEKDLAEFNKHEWIVFGIFSAVELFIVVILFLVAVKCGGKATLLKEEQLGLRQLVMQNTPTLPSFGGRMYIDDNCTFRITVLGFPNEKRVYYTIEEFNAEYDLESTFTSEIYSCINDLMAETDIDELNEISRNQP